MFTVNIGTKGISPKDVIPKNFEEFFKFMIKTPEMEDKISEYFLGQEGEIENDCCDEVHKQERALAEFLQKIEEKYGLNLLPENFRKGDSIHIRNEAYAKDWADVFGIPVIPLGGIWIASFGFPKDIENPFGENESDSSSNLPF